MVKNSTVVHEERNQTTAIDAPETEAEEEEHAENVHVNHHLLLL